MALWALIHTSLVPRVLSYNELEGTLGGGCNCTTVNSRRTASVTGFIPECGFAGFPRFKKIMPPEIHVSALNGPLSLVI